MSAVVEQSEPPPLGVEIVSVDDHVVEAPDLWRRRIPRRYHDVGPRVERRRIGQLGLHDVAGGASRADRTGGVTDNGDWGDVWRFEDLVSPMFRAIVAVGQDMQTEGAGIAPITYEQMRRGCYDPVARLEDMDIAGIDISLSYPNVFVRFCGQTFLEARDKNLALLCVEAYNDWLVEEWASVDPRRLQSVAIVPLWDPHRAAVEVRRNASRGIRVVSFSELPANLGLPSIHTDQWDPFFRACEETGTAIGIHIGSGSKLLSTSSDAPDAVTTTFVHLIAAMSLSDWVFSGVFERFPGLSVCFAECQIGWVPFILERADRVWQHHRWAMSRPPAVPPSELFRRHVYVSFFDDEHGLDALQVIGEDRVVFETDYPHSDSTWPRCREVAERLVADLSVPERIKVLRGNALRMLRLG